MHCGDTKFSVGTKYQDLCSEPHTYLIKKIGSKRIEKSLYLIPADFSLRSTTRAYPPAH